MCMSHLRAYGWMHKLTVEHTNWLGYNRELCWKYKGLSKNKSPSNGVWIGLYREPWTWSDNSNSLFRNWPSGKPNNADFNDFCVCEYSQHQWTDDDCALKKAFICEEGDCSLLQRSFSSVFVLIIVHLTCLWFYILYSSDTVVHTTVVKIRIQTDTNLTDHTINTQVLQQVIVFSSPLFFRSRNDRRKLWFEVILNLTQKKMLPENANYFIPS